MVLDGDALYVDRNGNRDLTETGERIKGAKHSRTKADGGRRVVSRTWAFEADEVQEGKVTHGPLAVKIARTERYQPGEKTPSSIQEDVYITLKLEGKRTQCLLSRSPFAPHRQDAPVAHFNGPLKIAPDFAGVVLKRGGEEEKLKVEIGTPGPGGAFAYLSTYAVPADVHPVAEIEFPPAMQGVKPIRLKVPLNQRC